MRLGLGLSLGTLALAAGASPAAPPRQPKLIVAVAVDQFSADLYQRYRKSFTGGLAQLGRGIAYNGYQSHAATETCPGHSTILTGHHPAATGIVANNWFDRTTRKDVYCVAVPGPDAEARGPANLRVDTFGDWLKRARPAARVVSISGKDRAAIMLGGHHADAVYWWQDGKGFATSPYAGPATPAVLAPATDFSDRLLAQWRAQPPVLWPLAVSATCVAMEHPETFGGLPLTGRVPPETSNPAGDLRASPLFDRIVVDFAGEMIDRDRLGRGPDTDLLAVSLSATDYVGHRFGNGGPEMCVQMQALDATLGRLLAKLDGLRIPYVVVLTADHGGTDAAERAKQHGLAAERIDARGFVKSLNGALRTQLGLSRDPIVGDDPQQLVIDVGDDAALRARVSAAAVAWLKARPEVRAVFTAAEVAAAVPPRGKPVTDLTLAERFNESYDPARSGDIQVAFAENTSFYMPHKTGDAVAGHGSPWDVDRRVPILFWWKSIRPQPQTVPAETVDIAPTLAAITHVPAPPVDGRCLPVVAGTCP